MFLNTHTRCIEIDLLSQHGVMLPPNMLGLTEEQVDELKLKDEFADVCVPSGGSVLNPDPVGRRNGKGTPVGPVQGKVLIAALVLMYNVV